MEAYPRPVTVDLRPARVSDALLFRQWRAEPSVRRFQPLRDIALTQLRNDVASQRMNGLYNGRGDRFQWVIEANQESAGWITLVVGNWEHGLCELGFALTSAWQGRGVMTQALADLLPELLFNTRLQRIEARCAVENHSSRRVLEKNGFRREGTLRGYFLLGEERVDHYLYAILKQDYLDDLKGQPTD